MKLGWLQDTGNGYGGAERTADEFRVAAPPDVEIVDCPPGGVVEGLDRYLVHNCVGYRPDDLRPIKLAPVFKYWHDVGPHVHPLVRSELQAFSRPICCSPHQRERLRLPNARLVPPALDLARFREAAENAAEGRSGAVCVGAWGNRGKSPERAREVAPDVDFYGDGACAPAGSVHVAYDDLPQLLARYRTFVYLPSVLEPFGRTVAEAWAAGCEVVTNKLVGARWWIEQEPAKLETAAADFWEIVTA
jgi:glycosyltransferase involved in cell wall biosynthesis